MTCYGLFHLGPVQDFIQTARRTLDYRAGSYLLSELTRSALDHVAANGGHVVFPSTDVAGAAIPNHFLARFELDKVAVNGVFASAADALRIRWEVLWDQGLNKFLDDSGYDPRTGPCGLEVLAQRDTAFDAAWAVVAAVQGEAHGTIYRRCEQLLQSRKATRLWQTRCLPEGGIQCTLCGHRLAVYETPDPGGGPPRRPDSLRVDWTRFRHQGLSHAFRDSEFLCGVCLVKRMITRLGGNGGFDRVPSTSMFAVTDFLDAANAQGYAAVLEAFANALPAGLEEVGPIAGNPVPRLSALFPPGAQAPRVEGDWYIKETYQNRDIVNTVPDAANPYKAHVAPLLMQLELHQHPGKYFAVLAFDGDSMGAHLETILNEQAHQAFSQVVAEFSADSAARIVETEHSGCLAYAGGDEGVAFVSLAHLVPVMRCLREEWGTRVRPNATGPTLSIGAVIAHHQQGLGAVIAEAQAALRAAKDFRTEKDAFAVSVLRRGNSPVTAISPWRVDIADRALDVVDEVLLPLVRVFRSGDCSDKYAYDLASVGRVAGPVNPDTRTPVQRQQAQALLRGEMLRLLARHTRPNTCLDPLPKNLADLADGVFETYSPEHNSHQFITRIVELAAYIAKGGGR